MMIIYNVTVHVEEHIHAEWLKWMKEVHIPEVMATGMFHSNRILKVLTKQMDEQGETYAVQYTCESMDDYLKYQKEFAPALQAKTLAKFGEQVLAFRTLMSEIE